MSGETKQARREAVWRALDEAREAAFPFPPTGRIPNFRGATRAAERLFESEVWRNATTIKANPDAPQRAVRKRALEDGKQLYVAVPRLRERECFVSLVGCDGRAATIAGAAEHGTPIHPRDLPRIDLVLCGVVAANPRGQRIGKGGGYADLELAIGQAFGVVGEWTTIVATLHDLQLTDDPLPQADHDLPLDHLFTPTRHVICDAGPRPSGIHWDALSDEKRAAIPILEELRPCAPSI